MGQEDACGQVAQIVLARCEPLGRQLLVREAAGVQRDRAAQGDREVDAHARERLAGGQLLHRGREPAAAHVDARDVAGLELVLALQPQHAFDGRLQVGAARVLLVGDRVGEPCLAEALEQRRPRRVREVREKAAAILDHVERTGEAGGGEDRGAQPLRDGLGRGQELRVRSHETGPQPERRLVERDCDRVRGLLGIQAPQP